MKYIVRIDYHIEARNALDAENSLLYDDRHYDKVLTFDRFEEAYDNYSDALKSLQQPKELKHGLYWFSGAALFEDDERICETPLYSEVEGGDNE